MVKKSVGTTPAILGNKIKQRYFHGKNSFELDVDLGSSSVAGGVLGMVKGYARQLHIDLAFLLEGQSEEELPEELMTSFRLLCPSLKDAVKMPADPDPAQTRANWEAAERRRVGAVTKAEFEHQDSATF